MLWSNHKNCQDNKLYQRLHFKLDNANNIRQSYHCKFEHLSNIILMLLVNLFRLQERTLNLNRNYLVQSCHFILKRPVRTHLNVK